MIAVKDETREMESLEQSHRYIFHVGDNRDYVLIEGDFDGISDTNYDYVVRNPMRYLVKNGVIIERYPYNTDTLYLPVNRVLEVFAVIS